jgi:hypothetical protein
MTLSQILSVAVASFALLAVLGAGGIAIVAIVSGGREDEDGVEREKEEVYLNGKCKDPTKEEV